VEYWRGYQDRDANLWVSALNDDGGPEPSSPHGADIWDAASACRFLATHPSYRALTRDPGVAAQLQVCAPSASGHADGTRSMPS
jgi:hypothetical protein